MKRFLLFLLLLSSSVFAGTTITTFNQTLSTTAAVVSSWDSARDNILIRNKDAAISIYIGTASVTATGATGGMELKAGESMTITNKATIYAIAASGTPIIAVFIEKS